MTAPVIKLSGSASMSLDDVGLVEVDFASK